ncbi:hypothetical protein QF038_004430 [Pseudarthrobacter sp. W1I19]|nr:hypothetical protein [Pseudarthrobacter sp. W1I19]
MRGMGVKGQQVPAVQAKVATPLPMAAMAAPAACMHIVPGVLSRKRWAWVQWFRCNGRCPITGSAILPKAADGVQGAAACRKCALHHGEE